MKKEIEENSLVMIRLANDDEPIKYKNHFNTWFRVKFIDIDGSFIGEVERINRWEFTRYKVGEHIKLLSTQVQHIYKDGEQFCYGDNISICSCTGLCRDK